MGKNKLKKFADLENCKSTLQYPRERLLSEGFPFIGKWGEKIFELHNPLTLELGCGKGEYTVALAVANTDRNYVGVDIKGARIWSGAMQVEKEGIRNAKFLRTEIENIDKFFGPEEVDEIWITFPDPQMQKTRKRLTSSRFLSLYKKFLTPTGVIRLKTDSPFLYEYTRRLAILNDFEILEDCSDLYGSGKADAVTSIKTFYESQWLSRGKTIKYIAFRLPADKALVEPDISDIEKDDYRSVRGRSEQKN